MIQKIRVGIGQDSHRFLQEESSKPCVIGGVFFDDVPGLAADSDGDVILHAMCNAITSLAGVPILGGIAIDLCHRQGITDSAVFLEKALKTLGAQKIIHIALSVEGKRPRMEMRVREIRENIARLCEIQVGQVGLTITSGDGLTEFGCGLGLQCLCIITTCENPS